MLKPEVSVPPSPRAGGNKMAPNAAQDGEQLAAQPGDGGLSERELKRVARFIGDAVGIQLPDSKKILVEGRLRRRLRKLGYSCFKQYLDFVLDDPRGKDERLHLIDVLTTNKTDFFREPEHFDYLINQALPELDKQRIKAGRADIKLWSAGCSTGEEPYTLSIVMNEAMPQFPGMRFQILATDISHSCLQTGKRGVYTEKNIEPVPMELRKKYFLRSRDRRSELVQMGPDLRQRITFQELNLMDEQFSLPHMMDVIFYRNVMIYFNNEIRERLVAKFERQLHPGGYLFVGHSESLNAIDSSLEQVAPMVYRKG